MATSRIKVLYFPNTCVGCKKDSTIQFTVTEEQYEAYRRGAMIQDVLPQATPDEREQAISGMHGKCFDKLFEGQEE